MLYQEYLRYQTFRKKIIQRTERETMRRDRPICIRDLSVVPNLQVSDCEAERARSFGEACVRSQHYADIASMTRLVDQIELFAQLATTYHHEYACQLQEDGQYHIMPECVNHITRLSLPEFAFYTILPLTLREFSLLVGYIETVAKQYPENVHLVISSLAVVTEDGHLLNTVLYLQCGVEPIIHLCCKALSHESDISYKDAKPTSQKATLSRDDVLSPLVAGTIIISHQSVFEVATVGGARYMQALDICLDYQLGHSYKLLREQLTLPVVVGTGAIPYQVDHMVTSNSTALSHAFPITSVTTHLDPLTKWFIGAGKSTINSHPKPMAHDTVTISKLRALLHPRYEKTTLTTGSDGSWLLQSPYFGYDCTITVQELRALGSYTGELAALRVRHQQDVTDTHLKFCLSQHRLTREYEAVCQQAQQVRALFKQLKREMLVSAACTKTDIQANTKRYQLARDIRKLITTHEEHLNHLDPMVLLQESRTLLEALKREVERLIKPATQNIIRKIVQHVILALAKLPEPAQTSRALAR